MLDLKSLKRANLHIWCDTDSDPLSQLLVLNHHESLKKIYLNVCIWFDRNKTPDIAILANLCALKHLDFHCLISKGILLQIVKITQIETLELILWRSGKETFDLFLSLCDLENDDLKQLTSIFFPEIPRQYFKPLYNLVEKCPILEINNF